MTRFLHDPWRGLRRVLAVAALALLAGCPGAERPEPRGYFGPTGTMQEVAAAINANNRLLPTLWAEHYFEATIIEPDTGRTSTVVGEGGLLYRRPLDLRLTGGRPGARIFEIASNAERFWMTLFPEQTMWWGHHRNVGRDCMEPIPIRPDLVLEVLGIGEIDDDFLEPPVPVMRFNNDADAYMFTWNLPGADRWMVQKEIWYDRRTLWPTMVLLFDADGRVILRAYLTGHAPVQVEGVPTQQWPVVAREFRLFFPDSRSRMWIQLAPEPHQQVLLRRGRVPEDRSFAFPRAAGVDQVLQVDELCE